MVSAFSENKSVEHLYLNDNRLLDRYGSLRVSAYASPTASPVLTCRSCSYRLRQHLYCPIVSPYAPLLLLHPALVLTFRITYAISGTDLAYAPTALSLYLCTAAQKLSPKSSP
eukprot:273104-Rhodomonas_salina.1